MKRPKMYMEMLFCLWFETILSETIRWEHLQTETELSNYYILHNPFTTSDNFICKAESGIMECSFVTSTKEENWSTKTDMLALADQSTASGGSALAPKSSCASIPLRIRKNSLNEFLFGESVDKLYVLEPNGRDAIFLADLPRLTFDFVVDSHACLVIVRLDSHNIGLYSLDGRYVKMLVRHDENTIRRIFYDRSRKRLYFIRGSDSSWQLVTTEIDNPRQAVIANINDSISEYIMAGSIDIVFVWCTVTRLQEGYRYDMYHVKNNYTHKVIPQILTTIISQYRVMQIVTLKDIIVYCYVNDAIYARNVTSNRDTFLVQCPEDYEESLSVAPFGDEIAILCTPEEEDHGYLYIYNLDGRKIWETVTQYFGELRSG